MAVVGVVEGDGCASDIDCCTRTVVPIVVGGIPGLAVGWRAGASVVPCQRQRRDAYAVIRNDGHVIAAVRLHEVVEHGSAIGQIAQRRIAGRVGQAVRRRGSVVSEDLE